MFSSGNRGKENSQNYPTQWALNPSAYQNVSNEHVDWAALAQQWIMMKESVPPEHPPANTGSRKEILNEGGEAPMDVEKEDADDQWPNNETTNNTVHESWNWQQWGAWPGNWNGPPPAAGVPQPATASPMNKTALLPTPYTHFAPNTSDSNSAHSTDYQNHFSYDGAGSSGGNDFGGSSSGYWTAAGSAARAKIAAVKQNRIHRKGFSSEIRPESSSEPVTLDAAKRRQLPAWIREGLEKMEREKQKQLDRERERLEREELLNRKKEEKEEALELLRSGDGNILPPKSKFDSDSGESAEENRNGSSNRGRPPPQRSRRSMSSSKPSSPLPALTEEERMAMVRRAMTEVLLQVTSSEIDTICQEEMNRFRARTTAKKGGRPAAPSASPFAAGTLGLGMYGGGSSDSESGNEGAGPAAAAGNDRVDNERRNSSSLNNNVNEDGVDSRRQQQQNKESVRRRLSDSQNKRPCDAGSSDSTADDVKESGEQVDTTRSHGNSSIRSRSDRHRRSSSSSNSSTSSSRTSSSETSKNKRKKKKNSTPKKKSHGRSPRRHRRSSSSQTDDDSSSGSKSSDTRTTSSRDVNRRNQPSHRHRSRSVDSDKRRLPSGSGSSSNKKRRTERSRSVSSGSEYRRRTESSTSNRNHHDRSRRERSPSRRERSPSRSRHSTRSRRSRSRDRRDRRRSRSRDRRDSYRSRRRSRSRTRSRSGGGKRTRGH